MIRIYFVANLFLFISFGCSEPKLEYSVKATLDPNGIAPLTALLEITTNQPSKASIKVLGDSPMEQSFVEFSDSLQVPVVGLYPDRKNKVLLTLSNETATITDTVFITTKKLPNYFPRIEINKLDRARMEPGMHLCDMHYAKQGTYDSRPFIFDDQGQVRWYLNLDFFGDILWPIQRLKNGALLVAGRNEIYEYDMLGNVLSHFVIDEKYRIHHDIVELPGGDLLMAVRKGGEYILIDGKRQESLNDFIILFNPVLGKITKEWDLAKNLDVKRHDLNHLTKSDWLHMNGLAFNEKDSTIIVSGKNQGLVKISWDDELKWILGPKINWGKAGRDSKGFETKKFLLTGVDNEGNPYPDMVQIGNESPSDFDFPWGQHAPEILPNGNIMLFDNGWSRNFQFKGTYSRAVEYKINEEDGTVSQVWQYGKERGTDTFSLLISDVDMLPKTQNILFTPGFINNNGKIIEVTYPQGDEVFEATLYFSTLNGKRILAWGELDIMYRSERFELKY